MSDHRILLLGLGFWGSNWMRTLSRTENCEIVGIAGCEDDIARVSDQYGICTDRAYTDYREAIEKTDADIVIIAIPTKYHTDAAKLALAKGIDVLSEKPLASGMAEADEIVAFKQDYPEQKYMVDQNYRWRPHNQTMKQALQEGMIGEIGSIHIEFRQPEDLLGYREFLEMPLLQDVSIHHFDLIRFFTGSNCHEIFAHSYRPAWSKFQGKPGTEAVLRLEGTPPSSPRLRGDYGEGVVVNYNGTWAARGRPTSWDGDITITGEKGCLKLDSEDVVRFFAPGDDRGKVIEPVEMELTELDYALSMLIHCIQTDSVPETTVEDNYHSFAMVCAAEESVRANASITLPGFVISAREK